MSSASVHSIWKRWYVAAPALLLGGFLLIYFACGLFITLAVNKLAPQITGVPFSVSRVGLSPFTGHVSIGSLRVGNPPGYNDDDAVRLSSLALRIRPSSLFASPVHLTHINIRKPHIAWQSGAAGSNLQLIQRNIQQFTGSSNSSSSKRLRVDSLSIEGATVSYRSQLTGNQPLTLKLPPIRLQNIGNPAGVTPQQLAGEIFKRLNQSIAQAIAGSAGSAAGSIVDGVKGLFGR